MRFLNRQLLICISLVFLSCASASKNNLYVNLTDNSGFLLLPPEKIEQNMDMVQYITFKYGERIFFVIAWVKADINTIEMAFFNELGAGIGELSYGETGVYFSSTVIPRAFLRYIKPEYIIADFQLCFYEPVSLGQTLEESGFVLEIQDRNRRVLNGNEVIIDIIKTDTSISLINSLHGYAYIMEGDFLEIK